MQETLHVLTMCSLPGRGPSNPGFVHEAVQHLANAGSELTTAIPGIEVDGSALHRERDQHYDAMLTTSGRRMGTFWS